ncbi:MAG TPA: acyl-CoA dehydrogenase family protein [Acetobacteraceae bacterium]
MNYMPAQPVRHDPEQPAPEAPLALDDLLSEIAARRNEFERLRHVPPDAVALMKRAGIYRASTPKRFGGDALPPATFMRTLERIAALDGSAAWVAAFGSANVYLASLPLETQAQIYAAGPDQVFAGGLHPMQAATRIEGGWRASGRWHFASGCKGAAWLGVGIGGTTGPASDPGPVRPLTAVFPAAEVEIVENWDVVGMRGTGSHDLRLRDKEVRDEWTFLRGTGSQVDEPLYRYPAIAYQAGVHAVCNIGLARAALDLVTAMADGPKGMTGAPRLADRAYFRAQLGRAEAQWRGARAFFYEASEQAWDTVIAGDPVLPEQASLIRLSATFAAQTGADVVQHAFRLGGIAAIRDTHPLQRMVRDSMVVTQHAFLNETVYENAGALFTGVPPVPPYP